jgi:pimeloyl-ACP methyl ester carboxylesterase
MAAATETTLKIRDCSLFLRRGGSGEPMLFLHGAGGLPGWLPFLEKLADKFDVLAPDHPSYGRSDTPGWLEAVSDLAYFYLDFLEQLKLDRVHIVGHSMGGWTALEMAIRSTQRIKSLTLISPAGIRIKGAAPADIFVMDRKQLLRTLYVDPKIIERELAVQLTPEMETAMAMNRVAAARLCWTPRLFNPQLEKWLHRVTVPTHIIWGDGDKLIPPVYGPAFHDKIPGAKLTVIPKTGHVPFVEDLDATVRAVTGFVRS